MVRSHGSALGELGERLVAIEVSRQLVARLRHGGFCVLERRLGWAS